MHFSSFIEKLSEETYKIAEQEESKNLAKEDALALIAEFVKEIKKKFNNKKEDVLAILKAANETLDFYIDRIEGEEPEESNEFDIDNSVEEPESDQV